MALFSVEDYEFDSHDDRSTDRNDIAEKHAKGRGMGLNVSKRSHNFKQLQKAALRMRQKLEQENIRRHEEKEERREELAKKKWNVEDKEQIRKERRRNEKKTRREERRMEQQVKKCLLAEENRELIKNKQKANKYEDM